MTRFEREYRGMLGDYWTREAHRAVSDAEADIESGAMLIDGNGVARWASNGRCIMDDMAEIVQFSRYAGIFNRENTRAERDIEDEIFLGQYREERAAHGYSEEELFEMRAAFGAGTTIVDVITGREITL